MKKSAILLLLAMLVAYAMTLGQRQALAAALEPTDSGAPSAIVIFPVGEKNTNKVGAMPPVVFNHYIHEKWMSKTDNDCIVCHHTGEPVACTTCHTVEGTKESKGVTLERAMHAKQIAKRTDGTPSSCVSCHIRQTRQRECAGCHKQLVRDARQGSWCMVCHNITPAMTEEQFKQGISNKLSATQNEALGVQTEKARKSAKYWSPMSGPYKVDIDSLASGGKYMPVKFNHRQHVNVLMERIKNNDLANTFHTQAGTICVTCHHNSPQSQTPPRCISCHEKNVDMENAGRPRLMAAFHLQCMNCHTDMKVARPRNTDCTTCHKQRPADVAAK